MFKLLLRVLFGSYDAPIKVSTVEAVNGTRCGCSQVHGRQHQTHQHQRHREARNKKKKKKKKKKRRRRRSKLAETLIQPLRTDTDTDLVAS